MTKIGDLAEKVRDFADEISDLLNGTITNGIRLGWRINPAGTAGYVGLGIGKRNAGAGLIPLTIDARTAENWLLVTHVLVLDVEATYLTAGRTSYGVYRDEDGDQPLFRYDYIRDNKHHADAHFHLEAEFVHGNAHGVRPPPKLHMPVGGRRFRPSLEDMIEFLIREGYAVGRDGWEDATETGRRAWYERQLRAAVRRDPEIARAALAELGD